MHGRLLILGAACLMTTSVVAADLPVEPVYVAPVFDWTGFYVGINAGIGAGTFDHPFSLDGCYYYDVVKAESYDEGGGGYDDECYYDDYSYIDELFSGSADITAGGWLGGVQAGYNWMWDQNFLIGIEGDIQGSSIDGRVSLSYDDIYGNYADFDVGTSVDWFATIRPRIGWVNDRFVVYGTAGIAWGGTTSSINGNINGDDVFDDLGFDNEQSFDRFGWTIGAGVEYAVTDNISFKTEFLFVDLGSEELFDYKDGDYDFTVDSDVSFSTIRAGLNFRF